MTTKFLLLFLFTMPLYVSAELGHSSDNKIKPNALFDKEGKVLPEDPNSPEVNWSRLGQAGNAQWRGVGSLVKDGKSSCTTTLFKIPSCKDPKRKAQILTNGHCVEQTKKMSVSFDMFYNVKDASRVKANVSKPLYNSYAGIDLAILELDQSYEQLEKKGVEALPIAKDSLKKGKQYELLSVPVEGMSSRPSLYKSECNIGDQVTLIDTTHRWDNAVEFDGCSALGGSSGSALIRNGEITGLLNAGNRNMEFSETVHTCEVDSCTMDKDGKLKHEMKNFGFDVSHLHSCYQGCDFNPNLKGCALPQPGSEISAQIDGPHGRSSWTDNLNKHLILDSKFESHQVKACANKDASCSCEDPSGYQVAKKPMFRMSEYLPGINPKAIKGAEANTYVFCLRGVHKDGRLDSHKNITRFPVHHYSH